MGIKEIGLFKKHGKFIKPSGPISFHEFLEKVKLDPATELRGIFQLFPDMVMSSVKEIPDKNMDDQSINYVNWDMSGLFEQSDNPFFADTPFANLLIKRVTALKESTQQNVIFCFIGPAGSGKTTMLNNLLRQIEKYTHSEEGRYWETVWRIDPKMFRIDDRINNIIDIQNKKTCTMDCIEIPCPSHDHPILMVPEEIRHEFLNDLFVESDSEFQQKLSQKAFDWVFNKRPCTICESIYNTILDKTGSIENVIKSIFARRYLFDRSRGCGITVFNPGDKPQKDFIIRNEKLQERLDEAFGDSNQVVLANSSYARTNNGVYALMDVKDYNKERLTELHNIISDGVLKAGYLEERIQSIFFAVMNPGDEKVIEGKESFKDRIVYTRGSYIMEPEKEIKTLEQTFGKHIQDRFLPGVFLNFARIIISTRLNKSLKAIEKWIGKKDKYTKYCDDELLLLRMCLYSNNIPRWLSDEDKRKLTREVRQAIILDSENDGDRGFTGRDSQRILGMLLNSYKNSPYINMDMVLEFFNKLPAELQEAVGDKKAFKDFLIAIQRQYDYVTIQELKESLFYYNDCEIKREVMNYIHALNFDIGITTKSEFTGDIIEVTEKFFERIERKIFGDELNEEFRNSFQEHWMQERRSWEYDGVESTETFKEFIEMFKNNIKEKVLDPYMKENDNYFRDAVLSYKTPMFEKFDHSIKTDIERMIKNLVKKFGYSEDTAKEVCLYVIDNRIK